MDIGNTAAALVLPTGSGDTVLFDSYTAFLGSRLDTFLLTRYEVMLDHDQAGTLKILKSDDGVTGFKVFQSYAIGAPGAGVVDGPVDVAVEGVPFLRVVWTNGGTNQTVWKPTQHMTEKQRAAQS